MEVTKDCNLNCPHCIKKDGNLMPYPQDDQFDEDKAIAFFKKHNIARVLISGGEPLTKKDRVKRLIRRIGTGKVLFATNGLLLDEDMVWFLNRYKVIVMISAIAAKKCDAGLMKKINRRLIKYVIQPHEEFGQRAVELGQMFDCKVELTFDVSKVKELDGSALDVFEQNLKISRPYIRIATKTGECNRCQLNLEWRCDNSLISYRQVYGVKTKIPEGCAFYYQNLGEELFSRFLALAKEYNRPCLKDVKDIFQINKDLAGGGQIVSPVCASEDALFVWSKLLEVYNA